MLKCNSNPAFHPLSGLAFEELLVFLFLLVLAALISAC